MSFLKHNLILAVVILSGISAHAQAPEHFDEDIRALRNTVLPGFRCIADDYVQYAPGVLTLGLKVCGYEGRSGWGPMLVADGFSITAMTLVTRGMKYAIGRARPNGGIHSFPSGHTGTAFLSATMLHKEYGWRSPWWSIGGYTVAALTGVSRILNNMHWMSDIAAGAAIGIGAVHLGYWLSDLIFKGKYINPAYEAPTFSYDPDIPHYVASLYFSRRFIIGNGRDYFTDGTVTRGGSAGLSADIPLKPRVGIKARLGANSLTYSTGDTGCSYDALAGGYYNWYFGKRFEAQAKAMAGAAWLGRMGSGHMTGNPSDILEEAPVVDAVKTTRRVGANICAGIGFGFMLDENFKINVFADYDAIGSAKGRWLHSAIVGWGAAWVW